MDVKKGFEKAVQLAGTPHFRLHDMRPGWYGPEELGVSASSMETIA
jgi:hypothetical protein